MAGRKLAKVKLNVMFHIVFTSLLNISQTFSLRMQNNSLSYTRSRFQSPTYEDGRDCLDNLYFNLSC